MRRAFWFPRGSVLQADTRCTSVSQMKGTAMKKRFFNKGTTEYALLLTIVVLGVWLLISLVNPVRRVSNFLTEIQGGVMQIDFRDSSKSAP